jgi:hypothetical protein
VFWGGGGMGRRGVQYTGYLGYNRGCCRVLARAVGCAWSFQLKLEGILDQVDTWGTDACLHHDSDTGLLLLL